MTNKISIIRISAIAAALLALAACSGGGEDGHGEAGEAHAAPTSSSAGLPQGHVTAGEQLASAKGEATGQSCVDCHGAEGNAPIDATYPKLGGQYADYLAHALQQYRGGDREHALMSSQAKSLTDQQIADLAAYFGSRESQLRDLHDVH
ncbi:c-type cytochrome [Marilutibacter maris]|uniref:Cytochrome C biogenesis protein CcsA n=1 Tax=Marilutibacter maris TaxID=1605891 RepID=A0A2U9T7Z4_9GAMM|nr:c-type cytochrome [Lysobacter maris]AWV07347.1 cytochrome C biogenesis protein CcsA [Lysobacter maris]